MSEHSVTLGYYPRHCDFHAGDISLTDLADLEEIVSDIEVGETICDDWLYVPLQEKRDFFGGRTEMLPYSARIFGLPKTQTLTHANADCADHLEFLVWCLGFFTGMRLTTTERGFLDATPIKPGKLTDFMLSNCTLADAINLSELFWQQHAQDDRETKRVMGIIHSLFLSQYPPYLQYEEFTYLYLALDACFALTKSISSETAYISHAKRIDWMCQYFGIETPEWALPDAQNKTEISIVRNDAIHEALFFEQPLGFAIYGGNVPTSDRINVPLEMQALTCRLLVALLGRPECSYVKSAVNTRQKHGLDLS